MHNQCTDSGISGPNNISRAAYFYLSIDYNVQWLGTQVVLQNLYLIVSGR